MAIDYTSAALVESVKRRCLVPNSTKLFVPRDIVKVATEELHSDIVPLIMAEQEEYFVANFDQEIDTAQDFYYYPERAIGGKLRDVVLLDSQNKEIKMERLDPDVIKVSYYAICSPYFAGFYFEGDKVILYPNASALGSYSLRMKYYRQPNNILITSDAGRITAINTGTNVVTVDNKPSSSLAPALWTTSLTYDVIKGSPSFRALGENLVVTAISGFDLTFSELPDGMAIGDWVAQSGYSPIAQIPYALQNLLAQRTAMKVLESLGDNNGMKNAAEVYQNMVNNFRTLITPRSDGSVEKIVPTNGIFRRRGLGWGGFFR